MIAPLRRVGVCLLIVLCVASAAQADRRDRARRMFDRIVWVPPSEAQLNVFLVDFAAPWTNQEQTVFVDLNDYTLTVLGMIRDGLPFDQVLTADLVYVAAPGLVSPGYEHTSNRHYEEIQAAGLDLSDSGQVIGVAQSSLPGSQIGPGEAAGVLTSPSGWAAPARSISWSATSSPVVLDPLTAFAALPGY